MSDDPDSEIEFNLQRQAEEESPRRVDQEENALLDQDDINIGINGDAHGDHIGIRGNENYGSPNGNRISPHVYHQRTHDGVDMHETAYHRPRQVRSMTIKPDTFDGTDDWDQYISHFENCAELGQWTERERALTLAACLKGQARVFYASLQAHFVCNYKSLVSKLEQRFGSARQQTRWLSRLQSRQRLPHEPIASFGDDIRLMAQKAYPSLDSNAQEMLALQQFYKAVSLEMRCRLMDRETKNISDAVDVVERYEEIVGDSTDRRRNVVRSAGHSDPNDQRTESTGKSENNLERTLKSIADRLEKLESRKTGQWPNRQQTPKDQRTCFTCGSPDHFFRQCPHNRNGTQQKQPFNQNRTSGNGNPSFL